MPEKFEVTLVGNDQIGGMIDGVNEKVKALNESTQKASSSLSGDFAGRDAQAGLSQLDEKFSSLATSARKNVQNIGDMIPPLKNFGELSGKYLGSLGKFGIAGGAVYAMTSMANATGKMAEHAYSLNVSAQNMGLTAEKLSMITGAYRLAGVDEQSALQSTSAISDTFNDILRGGDAGNRVMSQLAAMGLSRDMIPTRYDMYGNETVIVDELLPVLERIYDSISDPQTRHLFAQATGLDPSAEALFNSQYSVQQAYNRAYEVGLVRLQETNDKLLALNTTLVETSASMGGWWNRTKENLLSPFYDGGALSGVTSQIGESFRQSEGISWRDIGGLVFPIGSVWDAGNDIYDYFVGSDKAQSNQTAKDVSTSRPSPYSVAPPVSSVGTSVVDDNRRRFLDLIAFSEGTYGKGDDGYNVTFGGGTFNNGYAYHPNIQRSFTQTDGRTNSSGAAGRYQFLNSTWNGLAQQLGLTDFGRESQDKAALELIRQMGALDDVDSGNWQAAVGKLGNIWASFPSSPYHQRTHSYDRLANMWEQSGQRPMAEEIAEAINQNPTQITLRIVGDRGEQTVGVENGGTVTTSMNF